MDITITPASLTGNVRVIPSKSQAHRLLICACFADVETFIKCPETNKDMDATAACLRALGASIEKRADGYLVHPVSAVPNKAVLPCGESGSTLRFMLPVAAALGVDATFKLDGRLPQRPLSPLWEVLEQKGCSLTRPEANTLRCQGKLRSGNYSIDGSISSQFVSGLMFALVLMGETCSLTVAGKAESKPYIEMTRQALQLFGARFDGNNIYPSTPLKSPGKVQVEGDWSNGAFFLCANALGNKISVSGLRNDSCQGDKTCVDILETKGLMRVSCEDIPDLVPILSVVAASRAGGVFTNIARLRLKESDRVASICNMLQSFGIHAYANENTLTVESGKFHGGIVDAANDHRIAMSAAIAATAATGTVTILGAECVEKSYPAFWEVYKTLGGNYEQHLR